MWEKIAYATSSIVAMTAKHFCRTLFLDCDCGWKPRVRLGPAHVGIMTEMGEVERTSERECSRTSELGELKATQPIQKA